jgi:hypothetical protein
MEVLVGVRLATANRIEAEIRCHDRYLRLRVCDNGSGIDPNIFDAKGRAGHRGLPGMRERSRHLERDLDVLSELGFGAEVEFRIPASVAYAASPTRRRFRWFSRKTDRANKMCASGALIVMDLRVVKDSGDGCKPYSLQADPRGVIAQHT